jgi:hypothetical protein
MFKVDTSKLDRLVRAQQKAKKKVAKEIRKLMQHAAEHDRSHGGLRQMARRGVGQ